MRRLLCVLALTMFATTAQADWTLDPDASNLSFGSIKNEDIGEAHHFTDLEGTVDSTGEATISITLASLETWIDIRNERMRDHLFETSSNPKATISASLDMETFEDLDVGDTTVAEIPIRLELNGQSAHVDTVLTVARLGEDRVMVVSRELVFLDAGAYGYDKGIRKLMELAELDSISAAVPVSIVFLFNRNAQ